MPEPVSENTQPKRKGEHLAAYQFKPGNSGRPKGSRNKLGEAFVDALQEDFNEHGPKVIEAVRIEKPDQYLKVIASVIPKEVHHTVEEYDELSDEELAARFLAAASSLGRSGKAGRGNKAPAGNQPSPSPLPN